MFREGQLAVHGLAILLGRNEAEISNRGKIFCTRLYSNLSGGDSRSSAQVQSCFPIVVFLSMASLTQQPLTFLVSTLLFFAVEQPTVPHMKEEVKTSVMNTITLISEMK